MVGRCWDEQGFGVFTGYKGTVVPLLSSMTIVLLSRFLLDHPR